MRGQLFYGLDGGQWDIPELRELLRAISNGQATVEGYEVDREFEGKRRPANMAISFPNRSRSYDATLQAVRFWGYDRSMENSFFVTVDALDRIQPNLRREAADLLRAFDVNRERIYAMAAKVYARGRRGSYELNAADV